VSERVPSYTSVNLALLYKI